MKKFKMTVETRKQGAIGAFQDDVIELTADNESKAREMALGLVRRNGLEPRFITKTQEA